MLCLHEPDEGGVVHTVRKGGVDQEKLWYKYQELQLILKERFVPSLQRPQRSQELIQKAD